MTAEGDPTALDKLDIRVVKGDLRIARQKSGSGGAARIHVVPPHISDATITGAGNLSVDRVDGDVDLSIVGAGNLILRSMKANDAELSIAGAGDMRVAGSAQRLKASIAGSDDIDASGLSATSGAISITGTGSLRGQARGDATVEILGPGDVELTGGARCKTRAIGPGEARCS
ncbi:GIN domain-containing protein [Sphingomonas xinjiangensis]|uniref:Putative auto-transporter adhesin head GIN domain-containing protein n=1 Tax=Sphingomonas xinjiangensis TaxID=643568 RepID=A0A840YRB6_9SPHN|nr:hypothetical protein [Sphingomonas xinjiangensis]